MTTVKIVLHMICGATDEHFATAALDNVSESVTHAVVNHNTPPDHPHYQRNRERLLRSRLAQEGRLTYFEAPFESFSQARNLCFDHTPEETWDWLLRLDADEVHYPERFAAIVGALPVEPQITRVRIPFWHLLSWRIYQTWESCCQLYRWHPHLRWSGAVHEKLENGGTEQLVSPSFLHYSYTLSQPEVMQKWQLYSDLEGDPEHYRARNLRGETLLEDRYALSGAPFWEPHPPGAAEIVAARIRDEGFHDGPLPTLIVVRAREAGETLATVQSLTATVNPDYPAHLMLAAPPERHAEISGWSAQRLLTVPEGTWDRCVREIPEIVALQRNFYDGTPQFAAFGNLLLVDAGVTSVDLGWQKALVNAAYCLPGYDSYAPKQIERTLLIPRDRWLTALPGHTYHSSFCGMLRPHAPERES